MSIFDCGLLVFLVLYVAITELRLNCLFEHIEGNNDRLWRAVLDLEKDMVNLVDAYEEEFDKEFPQ